MDVFAAICSLGGVGGRGVDGVGLSQWSMHLNVVIHKPSKISFSFAKSSILHGLLYNTPFLPMAIRHSVHVAFRVHPVQNRKLNKYGVRSINY